jgi:putative peptide zinc metalloprotease protein
VGADKDIDIYSTLEERIDSWRFIPVRAGDIEVFQEADSDGRERYVLRNPRHDKYLNLDSDAYELWTLIDGKLSAGGLCSRLCETTGEMDIEGVAATLELFSREGFLVESMLPLRKLLDEELKTETLKERERDLLAFLVRGRVPLKNPDSFFSWLCKYPFRVFETKAGFVFSCLAALAGLGCFVYFLHWGHGRILEVDARLKGFDIFLFFVFVFATVFVHEFSHGATLKRFGRKVIAGGLLIYFGVPVFFVDTTDMMMMDRRKRIYVSFAGPLANGVIAGLLMVPAIFMPDGAVADMMIAVGVVSMLLCIINLLPLFESDGHYMIEDFTRITDLRKKSLGFLKAFVLKGFRKGEPWTRNDRIFLGYGIVMALGTLYLIATAINIWYSIAHQIVVGLINTPSALGPTAFVVIAILLIELLRFIGKRNNERKSRISAIAARRLSGEAR